VVCHCRLSSTTCLLPLPSGGLLSGGADRCVRYWEPSWPERSYIVAGPVWPDDTGIMDHASHKLQVRRRCGGGAVRGGRGVDTCCAKSGGKRVDSLPWIMI
jgi:hypothetical protein